MEINIEQITDYISKFVDYINNFTEDSIEKTNAITRLEESVFWLTYLSEVEE